MAPPAWEREPQGGPGPSGVRATSPRVHSAWSRSRLLVPVARWGRGHVPLYSGIEGHLSAALRAPVVGRKGPPGKGKVPVWWGQNQ